MCGLPSPACPTARAAERSARSGFEARRTPSWRRSRAAVPVSDSCGAAGMPSHGRQAELAQHRWTTAAAGIVRVTVSEGPASVTRYVQDSGSGPPASTSQCELGSSRSPIVPASMAASHCPRRTRSRPIWWSSRGVSAEAASPGWTAHAASDLPSRPAAASNGAWASAGDSWRSPGRWRPPAHVPPNAADEIACSISAP